LENAIDNVLCKKEGTPPAFCVPKLLSPLDALRRQLDAGKSIADASIAVKSVCDAFVGPQDPCFGDILSFETTWQDNDLFKEILAGEGEFDGDTLFTMCGWSLPAGGVVTAAPEVTPGEFPSRTPSPGGHAKSKKKKSPIKTIIAVVAGVLALVLTGLVIVFIRRQSGGGYQPVEMVDLTSAADDIADSDDEPIDYNARDPPMGTDTNGGARPLPDAFYQ
jgi:hypothetical protein